MFLRIAGLVGSVLFLVYLADDYVAVQNPSLLASSEPLNDAGETSPDVVASAGGNNDSFPGSSVNLAATTGKVVGQSSTELALVEPEETPEIEVLPMTVATALTTRDIALPPSSDGSDVTTERFVINLKDNNGGSRAQVVEAALDTSESEKSLPMISEPQRPKTAQRAAPPESLIVNLMVVSTANTAIHAAPTKQSGIKAVVDKGFILTGLDVKGTDWVFVQDPKFTLSGYIRKTQLSKLLLTN